MPISNPGIQPNHAANHFRFEIDHNLWPISDVLGNYILVRINKFHVARSTSLSFPVRVCDDDEFFQLVILKKFIFKDSFK